jgi:hypothetical protein
MAIGCSFNGPVNGTAGGNTDCDGSVGNGFVLAIELTGDSGFGVSAAVASGALPAGLALQPAPLTMSPGRTTFVISGTPTAAGSVGFTVSFTDSLAGTGSIAGTLTISAAQAFGLCQPAGYQGSPFTFSYSDAFALSLFAFVHKVGIPPFTYGPLLWSGTNPGGLRLSAGGTLSGTPIAAVLDPPFVTLAAFNPSISVTDSTAQSLSTNGSLFVFVGPPPPAPGPVVGAGPGEVHGTLTGFYAAGQIGGGTK